ncbi:hypothetical protein ACSS6W_001657 [Trichoderma asperelloides]
MPAIVFAKCCKATLAAHTRPSRAYSIERIRRYPGGGPNVPPVATKRDNTRSQEKRVDREHLAETTPARSRHILDPKHPQGSENAVDTTY